MNSRSNVKNKLSYGDHGLLGAPRRKCALSHTLAWVRGGVVGLPGVEFPEGVTGVDRATPVGHPLSAVPNQLHRVFASHLALGVPRD